MKTIIKTAYFILIVLLLLLNNPPIWHNSFHNVEGQVTPSESWGVFFDTTGDIEFTINQSGLAVRILIPREFLWGFGENDTSFLDSTIINDPYYYRVIDESLHYPYEEFESFRVEIHSPGYATFDPPQKVFVRDINAPGIAGDYTVTIYTATALNASGLPDFSTAICENFTIPVSMREDPSYIYGYIIDDQSYANITAEGIVYAKEVNSEASARAFVNASTGFFNITGLYEGDYNLTGMAGYCSATGYAYALTDYAFNTITVSKGTNYTIGSFMLSRGTMICGNLSYLNASSTPSFSMRSIDDNSWFSRLGIEYLNYTVEAYDRYGKLIGEYYGSSQGSKIQDPYWINGTRYSGFGPGIYEVKAWVFGYVQENIPVVYVSSYGENHTYQDINLNSGGFITGVIKLPQFPRQLENLITGNDTGALFGGNILAEAYDIYGELKGLCIMNHTFANETVDYADENEVRFYILGFSDFYNQTYSGVWKKRDGGLGNGQYSVNVYLNGFIQEADESVIVSLGQNSTVIIECLIGGVVKMIIESVNFNPTTFKAHKEPWTYPERLLRVWLDGSRTLGKGETFDLRTENIPLNQSAKTYWYEVEEAKVTIWYVGNNWSTNQTIYYGAVPNVVSDGSYNIKPFTYGHVEVMGGNVTVELATTFRLGDEPRIVTATVWLQRGTGIYGSIFFMQNGINTPLTEKVSITINVESRTGLLKGTQIGVVEPGARFTNFSIFGFYNWTTSTPYQIPDHFYYVLPSGERVRDYGLGAAVYNIRVEEFGFDTRFMQIEEANVTFSSIHEVRPLFLEVEKLGLIYGNIYGYNMTRDLVPLSWVYVTSNGRSASSLDSQFRLFLLGGTYTVDFSIPGYNSSGQLVTVHNGGEVGLQIILDQSGLPFPSSFLTPLNLVTISVNEVVSNDGGTEYILITKINSTLLNPESVQVEWDSDKGLLNSTKGVCVCWFIPNEISNEICSVTSSSTIPEYGMINKKIILNPINVPEFSSIAVATSFFILSIIIALGFRRRQLCSISIIEQY